MNEMTLRPTQKSVAPAANAAPETSNDAPIPTLDLKAQYRTLRPEIEDALRRVMESQQFILGPEVAAFEKELASYVGCRHAIGVASGSDALLLALMALDIAAGDDVLTTPYTFFATAGAIARLGARPVFVDIEPGSYNIDPNQAADFLEGRHPLLNNRRRFDHDPRRVKVLLPVHLFGQCATMDALTVLAEQHGLNTIEDAAQAIGARYQDRQAGTLGLAGCFSFFPSKNLGAGGDAGAIVTEDDSLADKLRVLRAHGSKPKYFHPLIGVNSRLDALQAAILRVKLPHLDRWSAARQEAARRYDELFAPCVSAGARGTESAGRLQTPWRRRGDRHIFNQYVIRTDRRDAVLAALRAAKIGCEIYYPHPLHLQECFRYLGYRPGDLPHSEAAARESLALPMFPEIEPAQQSRVVSAVLKALQV